MKVLIIDGQGGGLGRQLVAAVQQAVPEARITAVGTNSQATAAMLAQNRLENVFQDAQEVGGALGDATREMGSALSDAAREVGKNAARQKQHSQCFAHHIIQIKNRL